MFEYLKDWRIWLMCFVIFLIIEFPITSWGKEFKVDKPDKKDSVNLSAGDLRFKLKFNKVQLKYKILDSFDLRLKTQTDESFNTETVILFTIEW